LGDRSKKVQILKHLLVPLMVPLMVPLIALSMIWRDFSQQGRVAYADLQASAGASHGLSQ